MKTQPQFSFCFTSSVLLHLYLNSFHHFRLFNFGPLFMGRGGERFTFGILHAHTHTCHVPSCSDKSKSQCSRGWRALLHGFTTAPVLRPATVKLRQGGKDLKDGMKGEKGARGGVTECNYFNVLSL